MVSESSAPASHTGDIFVLIRDIFLFLILLWFLPMVLLHFLPCCFENIIMNQDMMKCTGVRAFFKFIFFID